jgi:hypothetical protein
MPIFRYFVFVGGALLALLFVADFALPQAPAVQTVMTAGGDLPPIRIRSDRKLPERVVLDTSHPTIAPPAVKTAEAVVPPQTNAAPVSAEMSATARVRETFAQFEPSKPKAAAPAVKKAEVRPSSQTKQRRVARSRWAPAPGRPMMMVAQQPHFGLFNMTW